ncbi:cytochrome P450 [Streptomyces sp. NPDC054837]
MGNITGAGLRKAVLKALNPKSPGLVEWMRSYAGRLIDALAREGAPADLRGGFADPYSAGMHCRLLGIPQQDTPSLMAELAALRTDPNYAHLTDEMLATVGVTMFGAGVVSTAGFLTMALLTLIQHPGLQAELVADPGRIPAAVEELLRINLSIGDGLPRPALEDVVLGDVKVAAGDLVLVLVEGANFDPAAFPDPHTVDLDRANSAAHLSFGGGRHYCPATALGRRHAEIALTVLLERMPRLSLAVPVEQLVWRTGFMKRIPERLPVMW